jgi:hypothetical protein
MTIIYTTPQQYRNACSLILYYRDEQITPLCGVPLLDALLSIPGADACWFLAGALSATARSEWAQACARRARKYAARARYAAAGARAAARAAARARYAAAGARAAARAVARARYAAAGAEYAIAVRHGVMLLEGAK